MFGTPGGFGGPAARTFRRKAGPHKVGQLGQRNLTVAQLGTLLRSGHGDDPGDQTWFETCQEHQPLAFRERR